MHVFHFFGSTDFIYPGFMAFISRIGNSLNMETACFLVMSGLAVSLTAIPLSKYMTNDLLPGADPI